MARRSFEASHTSYVSQLSRLRRSAAHADSGSHFQSSSSSSLSVYLREGVSASPRYRCIAQRATHLPSVGGCAPKAQSGGITRSTGLDVGNEQR
eukprot:scaffold58722_cov31-Tisochrysis_lutea.AAC.1